MSKEYNIESAGMWPTQLWVYPASGDVYQLVGFSKVKVGEGEWKDGVTYCHVLEPRLVFTRDIESFKERFRLYEEIRRG